MKIYGMYVRQFRGNLQLYTPMLKRSQMNNLSFHFNKLEKEE